jgi:D-3-phosphoglycerate dehydrogenase
LINVFCTAPIGRFLDELDVPDNIELRVEEYATGSALEEGLIWCDAHISNARVKLDLGMLSKAKNLRYIFQPSIGNENLSACLRGSSIVIDGLWSQVEFRKSNTTTAEHTLTMILTAMKQFRNLTDDVVDNGLWDNRRYHISDLADATLGIIGFGVVGKGLRQLASGFKCNVLVYDPYIDDDEINDFNVSKVSLETLLEQSDVISLHCPLNKETYKILNSQNCINLKRSSIIVNCARGGVVCEEMVSKKIGNGTLKGYAADVLEGEDPQGVKDHHLVTEASRNMNIIISPHVGGSSYVYMRKIFQLAIDNIAQEVD